MQRRRFIRTTVAAAAAAPAIVRAQQSTKWKMQSMWSSAELTYKVFEDLCTHINKLCAGAPGDHAVCRGRRDRRVRDARRSVGRRLQGHSSWPGYFSGKDPGLAVISDFVFGYQHPWQAEAWFYQRGGLDMLREAYAKYNVYPVGVSWWGVESIVAKKPIKNMADFKGVKFRSPQGMTAEILTKLGASIVVLPGGEVYSALDKGVVDAADWATISMNQRMGFHEVAKFPVIVDHSMPVQEFSVNLATWKALPDDVKAARLRRGSRMDLGPGPARRRRRRSGPQRAEEKGRRAHPLGRSRDAQDPGRWRTRPGKTGRRRGRSPSGPSIRSSPGSRISDWLREGRGRDPPPRPERPPATLLERSCDLIDRINEWAGLFWGFTIIAVTAAVLYEVIARTALRRAHAVGQRDDDLPLGDGLPAGRRLRAAAPAPCPHRRAATKRCRRAPRPPRRLHLHLLPRLRADPDLGRRRRRLELVPDRRDDEHAVEPADLAGQARASRRPGCCCCCRASPTSFATSAGRTAGRSR